MKLYIQYNFIFIVLKKSNKFLRRKKVNRQLTKIHVVQHMWSKLIIVQNKFKYQQLKATLIAFFPISHKLFCIIRLESIHTSFDKLLKYFPCTYKYAYNRDLLLFTIFLLFRTNAFTNQSINNSLHNLQNYKKFCQAKKFFTVLWFSWFFYFIVFFCLKYAKQTEHFSFRHFFKTGFKNFTIYQKKIEGHQLSFTNPQFRERKMSLFNLSIFIHFTKIIIFFFKEFKSISIEP